MALRISSSNPWACIKIKAKNIPGTLKHIEKIWNKFSPDYPFEFHFFDDQIKEQYKFDQRILILFNYFTFLAISISCLGLFGLSAFFVQDRTKEIGIRKILGASVSGIFLILSRDSIKWVILASLIALPLASIAVSEYLQLYAYHLSIGLFYYIVSAAIAFFIALVTVS